MMASNMLIFAEIQVDYVQHCLHDLQRALQILLRFGVLITFLSIHPKLFSYYFDKGKMRTPKVEATTWH